MRRPGSVLLAALLLLAVLGACANDTAGSTAPTAPSTRPLDRKGAAGQQLAYVSATSGASQTTRIVLADGLGKQPRTLDEATGRAESLAWSPDGSTLAFDADRTGDFDLWVLPMGGVPRDLTPEPGSEGWPTWSPDGSRIAYFSNRDNPERNFDLWVIGADGAGATRLTDLAPPSSVTQPAWAPDGSRIAFTVENPGRLSQIWTVEPNGTGARSLTGERGGAAPSWAPDGDRLAFVGRRAKDRADAVYVIGADGSGERRVSAPELGDGAPSWSPDGRWIGYVGTVAGDEANNDELYVVHPDGTGRRNITRSDPGQERQLTWSRDGQFLAFTELMLGDDVYVGNADGTGFARVSNDEQRDESWPAFRPSTDRGAG